jgi:hypothetical protein
MATLDELFAEAGLSVPQRTNRGRTVTTPGSYEAPVEGIQDYGAFQRGFTAGITPGLIEKKKQDVRVDAAAKEFDALKLNELIETSDTDPIEFKKNAALRGQTLSLLKGDLRSDYLKAARNNDTQSMNNILGQLSNLSEGIGNFNTFLTESQKTDQYDMEASNYRIGDNTYTDADGKVQPLTFNQLAEVNNTNPKALSYVQKKDEYGAVDTFLTVKNSKYGSFEVNISDLNAAQIQNKLALKADYGTETASHIKENPIIDQNTTAWSDTKDDAGKKIRTTTTGKIITQPVDDLNRKNARAFALKSMGEDDFNELMPSFLNGALKRTDMFSSKEQKDNYRAMLSALQTEQGMKNYAETNGLSLDEAKQSVKDNVNSVIQKSLENEYLKRTGSYKWDGEKYDRAVLDPKTSTSPLKETEAGAGKTTAVGIVEDLNTQFNAITSDAEREFSKPGYKAGTTRGGEEQAPQMFNFLTNKSYVKGGSKKSINNVEYRIIGEGEDRKIFLDIFTVSSGKEDKLATVDLGDKIARRDFLTNIGQGLAVTSSEKQAVREETKALTESRELAFDVFKGLGVGEENENKWQQLAKAIRNNSSEGLNAEERKAFLKAGYGKK